MALTRAALKDGDAMRRLAFAFALAAAGAATADAMDRVRQVTRTDQAFTKYGLTGRDVVVAILDRGIDWRHPDFIKPDGTTRIKWILDMSGQNLCGPGTPPTPGTPAPVEYTDAQINAALTGGPAIGTRDAVGHGTATAGIAAGNGRALPSGLYRGIAPEADLIIVKLTSEGAPAHDTEAAESPFQGCIEQALDWLDGKVTALGKPVVALINSGTQWGPIDGTSAVSRKIDQVFGANRPGRVYVAAGGDEGGLANHAGGDYTNAADVVVGTWKASTATTYMQMWNTGSQGAQVTVTFNDGTTVGPVAPGGSISSNGVTIFQYGPGNAFYPWQSSSADRAVWIQLVGHSGAGTIRVRGTQPGTGHFDVYGDLLGPDLTPLISFTDHLVPGRLTDYAATLSAIVAANYVDKTSWTDVDGVPRSILTEGSVDALWSKSPAGPTRDSRLHGIDVTPPGQNCFASSAQNSYWHTLRSNLVLNGNGYYVRAGGTSGSAPILTGAVALLLQLRPSLTASQARQALRGAAFADGFTGAVPNASWGYGKLDVLAALDAVDRIFADGFEAAD
jgi:minor extracellular serine protease Vpr